ncbi:MAG: hypothetical protein WHS38_11805, partial [Thermodesulforhabdaceae bacterium]
MWKNLDLDTRLRSDGWRSYGIMGKKIKAHENIVVGKGPQTSKLLPWVHTMIANVKGILSPSLSFICVNYRNYLISHFHSTLRI